MPPEQSQFLGEIATLKSIYARHTALCQSRGGTGRVGERADILRALLHDVLRWPDEAAILDPLTAPDFVSYELRVALPCLVVQAKADQAAFVIPFAQGNGARRLRLSTSQRKNRDLWQAILSAQRKAVDIGARYAVATNGYSFVV